MHCRRSFFFFRDFFFANACHRNIRNTQYQEHAAIEEMLKSQKKDTQNLHRTLDSQKETLKAEHNSVRKWLKLQQQSDEAREHFFFHPRGRKHFFFIRVDVNIFSVHAD